MNKLYEKDTYLNPNILYLFNKFIYEYDMRNAGFNLSREFKLLPKDKLDELGKMKKDYRTIEIGKIQRKNPKFKEQLAQAFIEARRIFFEENSLTEEDVISIKKDAIFTLRSCPVNKIGDFIEFRNKHSYTSYIRINKKIEFYYSDREMDIKGIGEDTLKYHTNYLIYFIHKYFNKMETCEKAVVLEFIRNFIDQYKRRELPVGYYRRFERDSYYDIIGDDNKYYEWWEDKKDDVDISYNYFELLIKLAKIPL